MDISFFLGANSGDGFYSLYDDFPGRDVFLHIIKGGPGTGKSGYMRALTKAAQSRGLDTELILCSGDPASLDGLYIPALRQAWVDGTAPHVREPRCFGVDSDYVNLGSFCRLPMSGEDSEHIRALNSRYKAKYRQAYACLSAARKLRDARPLRSLDVGEAQGLQKRLRGIIRRAGGGEGAGKERRRFISAYSCHGDIRLCDTVDKLCKLTYLISGEPGKAHGVLELARAEALAQGAEIISCPDPLEPDKLQAVLIPGLSLGFTSTVFESEDTRRLRVKAQPLEESAAEVGRLSASLRRGERQAVALAMESLRQAKTLHDELELVYRPYMDFAALDAFTASSLSQLAD